MTQWFVLASLTNMRLPYSPGTDIESLGVIALTISVANISKRRR
jgi:hypothetical protein